MFDTASVPVARPLRPPVTATIGDLLAWIAEADGRCHDEALRDTLERVLGESDSARRGAGVVVLVRELVARAAANPAMRSASVPVRVGAPSVAEGLRRRGDRVA